MSILAAFLLGFVTACLLFACVAQWLAGVERWERGE